MHKVRYTLVGLILAGGALGGTVAMAVPAHASAASGCEAANTAIQSNPSGNPASIIVSCAP